MIIRIMTLVKMIILIIDDFEKDLNNLHNIINNFCYITDFLFIWSINIYKKFIKIFKNFFFDIKSKDNINSIKFCVVL